MQQLNKQELLSYIYILYNYQSSIDLHYYLPTHQLWCLFYIELCRRNVSNSNIRRRIILSYYIYPYNSSEPKLLYLFLHETFPTWIAPFVVPRVFIPNSRLLRPMLSIFVCTHMNRDHIYICHIQMLLLSSLHLYAFFCIVVFEFDGLYSTICCCKMRNRTRVFVWNTAIFTSSAGLFLYGSLNFLCGALRIFFVLLWHSS